MAICATPFIIFGLVTDGQRPTKIKQTPRQPYPNKPADLISYDTFQERLAAKRRAF